MQSVLVKIVPPAQTPAPCDQRTARVRTTVDLCLDLLAKVLRSATVRLCGLRFCERRIGSALTSWPKCCDLRLCGLRFCERRIGSALDPLRRSLRLASCEVHAAIGGTGLPAPRSASCERCSASCNRASAHAWPRCCELQSASCGLRLAHSSRIAARGLRLAGLQPDQAALSTPCAHAWHRFCELQSATCTLRTAYNSRIAARRTQVGHQEAGRAQAFDRGLQVARRSSQDATQRDEANGLLHTFSDS